MSIANWSRQRLTEGAQRPLQSATTEPVFLPLAGFTPATPDVLSPPESLISTQNVWVRNANLQPRWRLSVESHSTWQSLNSDTRGVGHGAAAPSNRSRVMGIVCFNAPIQQANNIFERYPPLLVSAASTMLLAGSYETETGRLKWSLGANTGNDTGEPSFTSHQELRGAVSTTSDGMPIMLFAGENSGRSMFCWSGRYTAAAHQTPSWVSAIAGPPVNVTTAHYSLCTGSPLGARDVVNFDNRAVVWGTWQKPRQVQWHVQGDAFDWTGVGSGSQDLADMAGEATRIFALSNQVVLASTQEWWTGRAIGLPYIFDFRRLSSTHGVPFHRAALQTPYGIFWLDASYMICRMEDNGQIDDQFGKAVQPHLLSQLKDPYLAFFHYDHALRRLALFYTTDTATYPQHSVSVSLIDGTWAAEQWPHAMVTAFSTPLTVLGALNPSGEAPSSVNIPSILVTSGGTLGTLVESATSDFGTATEEDATFGTLLADNWTHKARLVESRWDFAAFSASSATVSFSTTFGQTASWSTRFSLSANSNTSQLVQYPKVSGGPYWTPRIQSTNGMWRLRRMYAKFEDDGEAR